jgi:hypothetical protein
MRNGKHLTHWTHKSISFALVGNGFAKQWKRAANAAYPFDFIVEILLQG